MPAMNPTLTAEIAAAAARLVVEDGMEYGPAKRKAARSLGRQSVRPAELPSNEAVEDEVRDYLALFHADTQPAELAALREVAAQWMERLAEFRPHLTGAVWRGTATRLDNVHLQLYCDDSKAAEIALINAGVDYDVDSRPGPRGGEPLRRAGGVVALGRARRAGDGAAVDPRPRRPARRAEARRARAHRARRPRGAGAAVDVAGAGGIGMNRRSAALAAAACGGGGRRRGRRRGAASGRPQPARTAPTARPSPGCGRCACRAPKAARSTSPRRAGGR